MLYVVYYDVQDISRMSTVRVMRWTFHMLLSMDAIALMVTYSRSTLTNRSILLMDSLHAQMAFTFFKLFDESFTTDVIIFIANINYNDMQTLP